MGKITFGGYACLIQNCSLATQPDLFAVLSPAWTAGNFWSFDYGSLTWKEHFGGAATYRARHGFTSMGGKLYVHAGGHGWHGGNMCCACENLMHWLYVQLVVGYFCAVE
jgi:hypothetical protein